MTSQFDFVPLERVELGAEGLSYVSSALASGLTLSQLVLRSDLSSGHVYTLAPPGTPRRRLLRWRDGGLLSSERGLEALVAELRPLLQDGSAALVAENAMARPGDEVFQGRSSSGFVHGQEVYELCVAPSSSGEIRSCLRTADAGYALNAVVAEEVGPPAEEESANYLRRVVAATRLIVTRAYDGEGFVLWRATES